jgi:hypothetical protein
MRCATDKGGRSIAKIPKHAASRTPMADARRVDKERIAQRLQMGVGDNVTDVGVKIFSSGTDWSATPDLEFPSIRSESPRFLSLFADRSSTASKLHQESIE